MSDESWSSDLELPSGKRLVVNGQTSSPSANARSPNANARQATTIDVRTMQAGQDPRVDGRTDGRQDQPVQDVSDAQDQFQDVSYIRFDKSSVGMQ